LDEVFKGFSEGFGRFFEVLEVFAKPRELFLDPIMTFKYVSRKLGQSQDCVKFVKLLPCHVL
jgi:hypothetical protein